MAEEQTILLPFFVAPNLCAKSMTEGKPWDFPPAEESTLALLEKLKKMPKSQRRALMLKENTPWNVYSAVRGLAASARVSKENPPVGVRGFVADFDAVTPLETIEKYLNAMPAKFWPQFIEFSLSGKVRLIWVFEKEVMVPSSVFASELYKVFAQKLGLATLLAGYDHNSEKPTEVWTNGGQWLTFNKKPMSHETVFGIVCEVSKKASLFENGDIPLDVIAAEVEKRWPGRWQGDFKLDALGVRFWDSNADNPTGCQIKPDGMLCYTGNEPFKKWEAIFGRDWCEEQKVVNLGKAGAGLYHDGKLYWEEISATKWKNFGREDALLGLQDSGISNKLGKGQIISDAGRVLRHVQTVNAIDGAAPCVNYPAGIVELEGRRILNTAHLRPVLPVKGLTGDIRKDAAWTWAFLEGLFDDPVAFQTFIAWLQRSYRNVLYFRRLMGQALFFCGPKDAGKTLLVLRIIVPLLGNRTADPMNYLSGDSLFTDDLFECYCLSINDSDAPKTEGGRQKLLMTLKALVVNPVASFHAKFQKKVTVPYVSRLCVTLNNDPGSTAILPEVGPNTKDKFCYFQVQPFKGDFPEQHILEPMIAGELPALGYYLDQIHEPPPEILEKTRMGVRSYYHPSILALANSQTYSSNLAELLVLWKDQDAYWADNKEWIGTPTALLSCLQTCDPIAGMARDWDQNKIAKSLTSLAKQDGSGVDFTLDNARTFKITK